MVNRSKRLLVTGAAGRIGRAAVAYFASRGDEVIAFDRSAPPFEWQPGASPIRFVEASASDVDEVRSALDGCDAVVHLAAIPAPTLAPPLAVFTTNTQATMTILQSAAEVGVRAVVIASSTSVLGLVYSHHPSGPLYVPVDEHHPLFIEDPYALSKQCDEAAAEMHARRYDMAVTALRFPFVGTGGEIQRRAAELRAAPREAAAELWAYLDVRDAARACGLAVDAQLAGTLPGYSCFTIAAPDSLVDEPLGTLVRKHYPHAELRVPAAELKCGFDLRAAGEVVGFVANYLR